MFEPFTPDVVLFFRRFGGKQATPNMFLDPHPGIPGIPGWDGPPTIIVPLVYGHEAVGTFLHEAGHWECWFSKHPCRPKRVGVTLVNMVENEECAEKYALRRLLSLGDPECIRIRLILVCATYHTAPTPEQRIALWNVRQTPLWKQCEAYAPTWKREAQALLAANGVPFSG